MKMRGIILSVLLAGITISAAADPAMFPGKKAIGKAIMYKGLRLVPMNGHWSIKKVDGHQCVVVKGEGKHTQMAVIQRPLGKNYMFTCKARGFHRYITFFHRRLFLQ